MKYSKILIFLIILISSTNTLNANSPLHYGVVKNPVIIKSIRAKELRIKIKNNEKLILLDLRGTKTNNYILAYKNYFIKNSRITNSIYKLIPNLKAKIIVYSSYNFLNSEIAILALQNMGYKHVKILYGGIESWEKLNYPIELKK